ncbi:hypothetical protein FHU28_002691 [Micromonospora echinospora]|uniref:Uncharacterized protein n=1 Tax=Micromonospora echinospora TaxID=1877 RepID=A0ABR6MES6_MICEC|nr:hypothetical protein [Micromonospora echinospora]
MVTPGRGPYGRGRARTYPWPDSVAREVAKERFGLDRFLADRDRILEEETCASR